MKRSSRQSKNWLDEYLPNDEPQGDLVDRATVVAEAFRRRSLDVTLGRIEHPSKFKHRRVKHQRCERCGKQIPPARLKVLPSATRCVACQRLIEQQRRRRCFSFIPTI